MRVSPKLADNLPVVLDHILKTDADYLLFPEMSLTGYHGEFSQPKTEEAWEKIAVACRQSYVTAIIGTGNRVNGRCHIQSRIFSHNGNLLGTHEKLVPTGGDREWCVPGEELRTFDHHGLTFGCLICNDLWVTPGCGPYPDPRLAYQLGKRGVQILFHAINSGPTAVHFPYHDSNLRLRAMESGFHIVTANAAVPEGQEANAISGVMSPEGKWFVQCPRTGEQTYAWDIEVDTE
jgi:predicted amidohydrolase